MACLPSLSRSALVALVTAASGSAQTLVEDLNTGAPAAPNASLPRGLTEMGGLVYFSAELPGVGRELAVTDGSTAGSTLVRDILPGLPGSDPEDLTVVGGQLFFTAVSTDLGRELWVSDGTTAGTSLVADLVPGPESSAPDELTAFAGELFFAATATTGERELWKTDGTTAGTVLVHTDPAATTRDLTVVGSVLWFVSATAATGEELFSSSGTAATTSLALDLFPGIVGSAPAYLTEHAGELWFVASESGDFELWITDGTSPGTRRALDASFSLPYYPRLFTSFGSRVVFATGVTFQPRDLWTTDGTPAGTELLEPGFVNGVPGPFVESGGTLYFPGRKVDSGLELWGTDGTGAGTRLVADVNPGTGFSNPGELTALDGKLAFRAFGDTPAEPGQFGYRVWLTDGTPGGEVPVPDTKSVLPSQLGDFLARGTELWFRANRPATGDELYRSDSSASAATLVVDLLPGPNNAPSNPRDFFDVGGRLVFVATTEDEGEELWSSDGTSAGTVLLADIEPGPVSSTPQEFTLFEGRLYFVAGASKFTRELWRTDGTVAGTEFVAATNALASGSALPHIPVQPTATALGLAFLGNGSVNDSEPFLVPPGGGTAFQLGEVNPNVFVTYEDFTFAGQYLFFAATKSFVGKTLWRSDGTFAGTQQLSGTTLGFGVPSKILAGFQEKLWFASTPSGGSLEVWFTDGTAAGTSSAAGVAPGGLAGEPTFAEVLGARLLFDDGGSSPRLLSTEGAAPGSVELATAVDLGSLTRVGALLFFTTDGGRVLRVTYGTLPGTLSLAGSPTGPERFGALASGGDRVLFTRTAFDDSLTMPAPVTASAELWSSDGTLGGTVLVADTDPADALSDFSLTLVTHGPAGSGPEFLFTGNDLATGAELWTTDGTAGSEVALADVAPGSADSAPADLRRVGDRIFFSADDGELGRELHSVPFALTGGFVQEPFGLGCPGTNGKTPTMTHGAVARLGQPLTIGVQDGLPSSVAFLFVSLTRTPPAGPTCTGALGAPLVLIRKLPTDATGAASLTAPSLGDPTLVAVPLHFQFFVLDPGGPFGGIGTLSDALEVLIGP